VAEVCRKMGISEATFYNWKKKYGGLGVAEVRRLKQLEEENRRLKRMVADLSRTNRCCRMCFQENYKASPQAPPGGQFGSGLPGGSSPGMRGAGIQPYQLLQQIDQGR